MGVMHQHATSCGRTLRVILWLFLSLLALCACTLESLGRKEARVSVESQDTKPVLVRIAVCSAGIPMANDLTAAYATEDAHLSFDLVPSNSRIGLELVLTGQADLAIVGDEIGLETLSEGRASGAGLRSEALATDAIGVVVHKDWPLPRLSLSELARLFAGYYLDWQELEAGSGRPEIVCGQEGSDTRIIFERVVMGELSVSSSAIVMPHDRGVVEYVAKHPGAIGYASTALADDRVGLVALDGVLPMTSEIERGEYPLTHPLLLLASPRAPRGAFQFVDFAKSSQGRRIIKQRYLVSR